MNRFLAFVPALALVGCNNGDVTKGQTVPPIAGIVGGPDAPGGGGSVGIEIRADAERVVGNTEITVSNESFEAEDAVVVVPEAGAEFITLSVKGDVGHELRVSLTHPEEGHISRVFEVAPPEITEVRDPLGTEPVIHAGMLALISGSGFCLAAECNAVLFDSTLLAPAAEGEPRPGVLHFTVPVGAATGPHTVRVATAGTEGGDEHYVSEPFTVTLEPNG